MRHTALLVIVSVFAIPASAATIYSTGFETSEGYTLADLNAQNGWVADSYAGDCVVQGTSYSAGAAALQIAADGSYDQYLHLGAYRTFAEPPVGSPLVTILQNVRITAADEADYVVAAAYLDPNTAQITFRTDVHFEYLGNILVNNVDTGYDWDVGTWRTVRIDMDFNTNKANVFYGGTQVATDANFESTGPINNIAYATDDYVTSGSSMFVDEVNITATPEPMTLGLVAIGGLGLLRRRRR